MSPYSQEMGLAEPMGSTEGVTDEEISAPDTISPTPSPSPSGTPSPPVPQEQDDCQQMAAMNVIPMLQNASTDCLPIDHNLPHLLRKVSGNADLYTIRDIKLQVISREMSLQRLALFIPNLKELSLDGSCLGSLRDLGCGLASLHVLRVSRCGLESLDGTFGLSSLRELYAASNQVDDIGPCSCLANIRTIDLSKNAIGNVNSVEYLKMCQHLADLTLSESPVAQKPGYRHKVCSFLPNLATLDGVPIAQHGDPEDCGNNEGARTDQTPSRFRTQGASFPESQNVPIVSNDSTEIVNLSHSSQEIATSLLSKDSLRPPVHKKRPATTGSSVKMRVAQSNSTLHNPRPASSSAIQDDGEASGSNVGDHQCDSPSALTSGMVVCGNLIMALRGRRKRTEAWTDEEATSQSGIELAAESSSEEKTDNVREKTEVKAFSEDNILSLDRPRHSERIHVLAEDGASWSAICEQDVTGQSDIKSAEETEESATTVSDDCKPITGDVLEESKKWREKYTEYRSQNRLRWEKEKDYDPAPAYNSSKTREKRTSCEEKPNKTATCCPHLFSRHKPATGKNKTVL